jgi:hypothetical protein
MIISYLQHMGDEKYLMEVRYLTQDALSRN